MAVPAEGMGDASQMPGVVEIQTFTPGMDFDSFSADARTLKAVELNLIVIGEAVNQIPDDVKEAHPQIPWSLMRAMPQPSGLRLFAGRRLARALRPFLSASSRRGPSRLSAAQVLQQRRVRHP